MHILFLFFYFDTKIICIIKSLIMAEAKSKTTQIEAIYFANSEVHSNIDGKFLVAYRSSTGTLDVYLKDTVKALEVKSDEALMMFLSTFGFAYIYELAGFCIHTLDSSDEKSIEMIKHTLAHDISAGMKNDKLCLPRVSGHKNHFDNFYNLHY